MAHLSSYRPGAHGGTVSTGGFRSHFRYGPGLAVLLTAAALALAPAAVWSADQAAVAQADRLLKFGQELADRTNYLEALDVLEDARDILEAAGATETLAYGDVLYALSEARIKGRLHQGFPAQYVKTALKEVQMANKVRERLAGIPPRKLAEGFFVEGYIHKRFFRRNAEAEDCFRKAVNIDPGFAAAKRELGELTLKSKR